MLNPCFAFLAQAKEKSDTFSRPEARLPLSFAGRRPAAAAIIIRTTIFLFILAYLNPN
jgi:hypothetical protein